MPLPPSIELKLVTVYQKHVGRMSSTFYKSHDRPFVCAFLTLSTTSRAQYKVKSRYRKICQRVQRTSNRIDTGVTHVCVGIAFYRRRRQSSLYK